MKGRQHDRLAAECSKRVCDKPVQMTRELFTRRSTGGAWAVRTVGYETLAWQVGKEAAGHAVGLRGASAGIWQGRSLIRAFPNPACLQTGPPDFATYARALRAQGTAGVLREGLCTTGCKCIRQKFAVHASDVKTHRPEPG